MTQQKNVTTNSRNMDLEKMTHEYFYPDVLLGEISKLSIPTVDELLFLGQNNLQEIKWYMRREEKKLREACNEARHELRGFKCKTSEVIQNERSSKDGFIKCNWRGMEYRVIPEDLAEALDDVEEYCAEVRKRESKIFTCKFGRNVAEWCNKTPNLRSCTGKCSQHTGATEFMLGCVQDYANIEVFSAPAMRKDSVSDTKVKCPHYNVCHGSMPFKDEVCVFDHADNNVIHDCKEYLENVITGYTARLDFVGRYLTNITVASRNGHRMTMPPFELSIKRILQSCKNDTRIVMLMIEAGKFFLRHGTVGRIKGICGEDLWFLIADNEPLLSAMRVSFNRDNREHFHGIIIQEEDFDYLVKNPDFRQVWLQMASFFRTGFNANHVAQILEASKL